MNKPVHALCENRLQLSSTGKMQEMLDSLFNNNRLKELGLSSIDFDFFVNWSNNTVSNEIWIKRIIEDKVISNNIDIAKSIKSVDNPLYIKSLIDFAAKNNFSLRYKLFHDKSIEEWNNCKKNKSKEIQEIELAKSGITNNKHQTVEELMTQIKLLSGGPLKIGDKGLKYSTSTLECYLSKSDAPWPGDVDVIIMDAHEMQPLVLIEMKKHTLNESIEEHTYEKYYKGKDFRKYYRLAILAYHLKIPFVIVYYSTKHEDYILIDKFEIEMNKTSWDLVLKLRYKKTPPSNDLEYNQLIASLIY